MLQNNYNSKQTKITTISFIHHRGKTMSGKLLILLLALVSIVFSAKYPKQQVCDSYGVCETNPDPPIDVSNCPISGKLKAKEFREEVTFFLFFIFIFFLCLFSGNLVARIVSKSSTRRANYFMSLDFTYD
jgi:hypothetical protein